MKTRTLGKDGLKISAIGLGCMGFAQSYTPYPVYRKPEAELLRTLEELGIGFVPFSPLGKAMLTGRFNKDTKFDKTVFAPPFPVFKVRT